jgi:ArsR family transcriptional regulator
VTSILKSLRILADPNRVRVLLLVAREELSVAELQEILNMGQSRISTHLAHLKHAGLVQDRRDGKNVLYRLKRPPRAQSGAFQQLLGLLRHASGEIPEAAQDSEALRLALKRRQDRMREHFDALARKLGKRYVPGRSWRGLAEALFRLLPPLAIADLGAGDGAVSRLLARRARKVIAVDSSGKMVEYGRQLARKHGVGNLTFRKGDIEAVPIPASTVDVAFFSQSLHHARHPERAVAEAWRILKPGGRVVLLDLVRHTYEKARELYAHRWLGFTEVELVRFLKDAGFKNVETAVVHREEQAPHFETVLAVGDK